MNSLKVTDVSKVYPTPREPLVVLERVSFVLSSGESLSIVGPSGSGKSTLLHILGTLDQPTSGTVELGTTNPFALDESQLAEFRNRRIGYVFQEHYLLPQLSVTENVLLPCLASGRVTAAQRQRAAALIERVGLAERATHRPGELSGGERQRAAIARALIMKPTLLLADEPTGNLDQRTAMEVAELLATISGDEDVHEMLVLVTHNEPIAARCSSRMAVQDKTLVPLERTT
jgi:lipoprotein-releasing system ATP-binding protein